MVRPDFPPNNPPLKTNISVRVTIKNMVFRVFIRTSFIDQASRSTVLRIAF